MKPRRRRKEERRGSGRGKGLRRGRISGDRTVVIGRSSSAREEEWCSPFRSALWCGDSQSHERERESEKGLFIERESELEEHKGIE